MAEPLKLAGVVAFIVVSLWMNKALQRYFAKEALS
jgi:hypothetical protein